jgi:hypothetical protein
MDAGSSLSRVRFDVPDSNPEPAQKQNGTKSAIGISLIVGGIGLGALSITVLSLYAAGKIPLNFKLSTIVASSVGCGLSLVLTITGIVLAKKPFKKEEKHISHEDIVISGPSGGRLAQQTGGKKDIDESSPAAQSRKSAAHFASRKSINLDDVTLGSHFFLLMMQHILDGQPQDTIIDMINRHITEENVDQPLQFGIFDGRNTLLHFAYYMGMGKVITRLIEKGGDPALVNAQGYSAKALACSKDSPTIVFGPGLEHLCKSEKRVMDAFVILTD